MPPIQNTSSLRPMGAVVRLLAKKPYISEPRNLGYLSLYVLYRLICYCRALPFTTGLLYADYLWINAFAICFVTLNMRFFCLVSTIYSKKNFLQGRILLSVVYWILIPARVIILLLHTTLFISKR